MYTSEINFLNMGKVAHTHDIGKVAHTHELIVIVDISWACCEHRIILM